MKTQTFLSLAILIFTLGATTQALSQEEAVNKYSCTARCIKTDQKTDVQTKFSLDLDERKDAFGSKSYYRKSSEELPVNILGSVYRNGEVFFRLSSTGTKTSSTAEGQIPVGSYSDGAKKAFLATMGGTVNGISFDLFITCK